MKPEESERFYVESLVQKSIKSNKIPHGDIVDIDKLTGDASTRRYYRVQVSESSYVVCIDDPVDTENETSSFVQVHHAYELNNVRVPRIFDTILEKGYFLEEDLGDQTLLHQLSVINAATDEYEHYQTCIDELLKIHSIDSSQFKEKEFTQLAFDEEKLMTEILFSIKFFIKSFLQSDLSIKEESLIVTTFLDICREIEAGFRVVTHRDFHSRNVMMKDDEMIIIDFQDTRMGIPQYDLVSLLEDCYYYLNEGNVDKLKKYYWDNFRFKNQYNNSFDEFLYFYDIAAVQRIFKAIGSFSFIYSTRQDLRYVKYIGYGMEKLRKILFKYEKFSELRKTLFKMYYAN